MMTALKTKPEEHESRDRLLHAAKRVFAQKGFDGASVKDLAEEAQVNVSLISYYFESKAGLYRACLENFGKNHSAVLSRILSEPESFEDFKLKLTFFLKEFIQIHMDEGDISTIIHRECSSDLPYARDIFKDVFLGIFKNLVSFFEIAQKKKILSPQIECRSTAGTLVGSTIHRIRMNNLQVELFKESIFESKHQIFYIRSLLDNLFYGILPQPQSADQASKSKKSKKLTHPIKA